MKKLLPFILLFFALNTFSQKEANFWYFGNKAALDFNSGTPVPVAGSELNTTEGCSSFSNANGELLFYIGAPTPSTSNLTVWNKNNSPMPNGVGIKGDASSSQSALTVPAPGRPDIYYLFTVGAQSSGNAGFFYYTIDMTANGGLGDIVAGPVILGNAADHPTWTEKVTAVRADACNTFWVISSHESNFYAYKVDNSGVDIANPKISHIPGYNASDPRGYLKVSPDGTKLVAANMGGGTFIFNFNDVTGEVTNFDTTTSNNPKSLDISGDGYGVEFSVSSRKLYISTGAFNNSTENLYQFDLTKTTITDLNASRFLVHSYFNTRGALQLGPDGKIYWTSDGSRNISVINNPDQTGAACNYSHQTVRVGNGTEVATQGLPPFISSLLLPIEITDSGTGDVINNQDLAFCVGQDKTIVSETVVGVNKTYEWTFDNGTTSSVISNTPDLVLTNLSPANNGIYSLKIELTDACGNITQYNGTFNIEVFETAVATKPVDIDFCDTDRDGFNSFDLQTDKTAEILDTLDPTIFEVLYFDTLAKATDNALGTELPNPYTNPTAFSSQTIYARVHNKNAPNACFDITDFKLSVNDIPVPVQPTEYRLCDDTASGSDIDNKSLFLLSTKDAEVLGTLDPLQYNVSYHTSLADAQTSSATNPIDKNNGYEVTNSQQVFVRVENVDNTNCNAISDDTAGSTFMSFQLIVDPLPVVNTAQLIQCHNNPDLTTTVNLKLANPNISTNHTNEVFRYFPTQADAIAESNEITGTDIETYPVTANGEAWVRVISSQNCYRIAKIEITVNFSADLNTLFPFNDTYTQCDDFLDADGNDTAANSDTDGISTFDFSDATNDIKALFPAASQPDLEVYYYETDADRDASINDINSEIANHRNNNDPTYAHNQTIYVKIVNKNNNGCAGTANIFLQVNSVPVANIPSNFEFCDDAISGSTTDGENIGINLRDKVSEILGVTQTEADYIVTFHTSLTDANDLSSNGIANDTDFRNSAPAGFTTGDVSEQEIFVRVQDRSANPTCYNANSASFKVIVNPLPVVTAITPLPFCDIPNATDADPRNRIAQNIDLTSKVPEILNGRTNHRVAFYTSSQNAINGGPEIVNTNNYENDPALTTFPADFNTDDPGSQTIFYKVIDQTGTQCESVFATFNLLIYPEPNIPVNISNYTDCDNTSDSFNDDDNGINGDISLKNKIPEILANYQPSEFNDFSVTFYTSLADAESGDTSLALNEDAYQNASNNETIYVRVENVKNTPIVCVNTNLSFNINIKPLPSFTVMGEEGIDDPQIICLNNLPLTLEAENPGAIYDYQWTDDTGNPLGNASTLNVTTGGKYIVTASDQSPDGCSRTRTIIVKESNIAVLEESFITIIDESNNIGSQDNISIYINTIDNDLGPGDYQFAIFNNDNNVRIPSIGFQDQPLFENLEGGIYTIIVNDKNGCAPDTTLLVSVIQFPKFFTPNGDGTNDTWLVKGANQTFYPNAKINIFNRFGKLVAQIPIDSQGWNGAYGGKILPSDDYWYDITLVPANTNKPTIHKKGNFSLLRK
ncbi:T9SS type B sorting domain-containing protein [Polaribacter sp. MSW13]|uniref:T9SS type B sorting domain-containing protein n=1 Tax=Polaribacter marinus TaxID=2916838 RepID=A0A9X1VKU6_9FLAO|nr:T9SS type B sorting domain-containing protein [Polaribacter marinus]MCI2227885.1 T9SS type B sorting domain-containing protein [Polaribacter marinus]